MNKYLKYLMLLLFATLSLTLASCGGDENEPVFDLPADDNPPEYVPGGYQSVGSNFEITLNGERLFQMKFYEHEKVKTLSFSKMLTACPASVAYCGNFDTPKTISTNSITKWQHLPTESGMPYFTETVSTGDTFLIELDYFGHDYYYILWVGNTKKSLSNQTLGFYYELQSAHP